MALIKCKECNKDVSDTAKICPHCGFDLEQSRKHEQNEIQKKSGNGCLIAVIVFILLLVMLFALNPVDEQYGNCSDMCGYLKGQGVYTSEQNVRCLNKCSAELEERRKRR